MEVRCERPRVTFAVRLLSIEEISPTQMRSSCSRRDLSCTGGPSILLGMPKGGLDTPCSLLFAYVHCVLETALFGLLRVVYLC